MMQYRQKPVVIEAVPWTGDPAPIRAFCGEAASWDAASGLVIRTTEGPCHVSLGEWLLRDGTGAYVLCEPAVFAATYEPVAPAYDILTDRTPSSPDWIVTPVTPGPVE